MKKKAAQIVLSAFLVFHLAAVFILPNPESIIFRATEGLFVNYGNLLGINTTWRFFSPNPMIHMLEYEVVDSHVHEDSEEVDLDAPEVKVYKYPESVEAEGSRESYNRQLNFAMYMLSKNEYLQNYLGPFLCKRHPGAEALSFYSVAREFPTVETARTHVSSRQYLEKLKRTHIAQIDCPRGAND